MWWVAGDDPVKVDALSKMPLLEYFMVVDKKLGDLKRQLKSK
jgi:hypothetical protein